MAALAEAGFPEETQQARFGQVVLVLVVVVVPEVHRPRVFRDEFGRGMVGQEVHAPHRSRAGESAEGATHAVVLGPDELEQLLVVKVPTHDRFDGWLLFVAVVDQGRLRRCGDDDFLDL